jgi:hypothetical protein
MPTHRGSYILTGQNDEPGETTNEKSHALLNKRRHLGVMRRGINRTWKVSVRLCRAFSSSSSAASATAGGGAHKLSFPAASCVGIQTLFWSGTPLMIP